MLRYHGAMNLREYVKSERGAAAELARNINAQPVLIAQWTREEDPRPVPIERCVPIERATNSAVMRWDLRPDDWHAIWPELVTVKGSPDVPVAKSTTAPAAAVAGA